MSPTRNKIQTPNLFAVGIANGRVVVVADSWREVADRLRQVEPDPARCRCIAASADYDDAAQQICPGSAQIKCAYLEMGATGRPLSASTAKGRKILGFEKGTSRGQTGNS
jgi:hypothetical protein